MLKTNDKLVTVRVPATSANCGPGFDCLGMACTLYDTFTFELIPEGYELEIEGEGEGRMHPSPNNLAFLAFLKLWEQVKHTETGLKVHMKNDIPLSRGLGSSSAAIVGGLMAANYLSGKTMKPQELLNMATAIEGHPDNVAPAILGGFTISFMENGTAQALRIVPARRYNLIAVIPDMPLSTAKARGAIPAVIPHKDAVFSASRAALLVGALMSGKSRLLPIAMEDKLHQPYRGPLIPGSFQAFAAAKKAGAYSAVISGSGSTLLAVAHLQADGNKIGLAMQEALKKEGMDSTVKLLKLDLRGAKIL
ncbi:MAG: homoserine kinase [Acidaminococcaceae bacterium]|jgi:homoserine kinase|nr:homoserine kinase [Acidaminococcaceae bacterium]